MSEESEIEKVRARLTSQLAEQERIRKELQQLCMTNLEECRKRYPNLEPKFQVLDALNSDISQTIGVYDALLLASTAKILQSLKESAEKQLDATTALRQSSRTLETLTLFLVAFAALTAAYSVLGPSSGFGQAYPILLIVFTAIVAYWVNFHDRAKPNVQSVNSQTKSEGT